jgi:hypothetical protein
MKLNRLIALAIVVAIAPLPEPLAFAHGGGLNKQGCHNNRKTGDYHCHRAQAQKANPKPAPEARSNLADDKPKASVYYRNCAAARAAGAAPVRRNDPGYGRHLDQDNDGIGCE